MGGKKQMNKKAAIFFAALMSLTVAVRAAEGSLESAKANGLDTFIDVLDIVSDLAGNKPQHPGQPNHPGQPGHQPPPPQPHHPPYNPGHPPVPPPPQPHQPSQPHYPPPYNPGWDNHNQPTPQYHFGGYRESCRTMEFNAQSPLSQTLDMIMDEYGEDCLSYNHGYTGPCRPATKYHKRKVTVNIGPRNLEAWEKERLEVCMKGPSYVTVDTSDMVYDYSVTERKDDGLFRRATIFTLTPGAKKPAKPDSEELTLTFAGITTAGDVRLTLKDNRADYFRGERITITADGMNLPEIDQNMPVDQVLNSFVKFNVTKAFDVAGSYELTLIKAPVKPGKYFVNVDFFRSGPLSSGETTGITETFEIK